MNAEIIGAIVKLHRKTAGLTRVDLARLSGVGRTTIFDIEHGKETVQLKSLLLVFDALGIQMHLESRAMDTAKQLLTKGKRK